MLGDLCRTRIVQVGHHGLHCGGCSNIWSRISKKVIHNWLFVGWRNLTGDIGHQLIKVRTSIEGRGRIWVSAKRSIWVQETRWLHAVTWNSVRGSSVHVSSVDCSLTTSIGSWRRRLDVSSLISRRMCWIWSTVRSCCGSEPFSCLWCQPYLSSRTFLHFTSNW